MDKDPNVSMIHLLDLLSWGGKASLYWDIRHDGARVLPAGEADGWQDRYLILTYDELVHQMRQFTSGIGTHDDAWMLEHINEMMPLRSDLLARVGRNG